MRKLIIQEFLTLDGVMQAPGGDKEDVENGFKDGGWQMKYTDPAFGQFVSNEYASADTLLLGRKTYDIFSSYWPTTGKDFPIGKTINAMTHVVVSRTLTEAKWNKAILIKENVEQEIAKLKEQPGKNILIAGSGNLAQTLMKANLIDEFQLLIYPLTLGSGKKLFLEGGPHQTFKLANTPIATATGAVILRYARAAK